MGIGIDCQLTRTIDSQELSNIFGIEAGRCTIINEIKETMSLYGINLNNCHLFVLSDIMTFKGKVLGCQRHGLKELKDSTLALASYETTIKILTEGARYNAIDPIVGIDENCIIGWPASSGTGICSVIRT